MSVKRLLPFEWTQQPFCCCFNKFYETVILLTLNLTGMKRDSVNTTTSIEFLSFHSWETHDWTSSFGHFDLYSTHIWSTISVKEMSTDLTFTDTVFVWKSQSSVIYLTCKSSQSRWKVSFSDVMARNGCHTFISEALLLVSHFYSSLFNVKLQHGMRLCFGKQIILLLITLILLIRRRRRNQTRDGREWMGNEIGFRWRWRWSSGW